MRLLPRAKKEIVSSLSMMRPSKLYVSFLLGVLHLITGLADRLQCRVAQAVAFVSILLLVDFPPRLILDFSDCIRDSPRSYLEWAGWIDPHNSVTQRWGPAVSYHSGFKWIWLNQGQKTTPASLEILTIYNVVFEDERYASERGILSV
jgi:hypothetical protein